MIRRYVREKRSWLLLILILQGLTIFVAFVDVSVPLLPILYIVGLNWLICIAFMVVRYHKETRYYRSLEMWDHINDLDDLQPADRPFESIVHEALSGQSARYETEGAVRLRQLEQEKDELLSWIHEVKTPLSAMRLMLDRVGDPELRKGLSHEWQRIHHLLDQQLHRKRILSIENDLMITETLLEPVLNTEIRALQSWCMSKGIGFELNLDARQVLTDPKWLSFVLRQLLTNAVKYSESSDILIHSHERAGHVQLMIQDAGRGIERRDLPRIFEKGFTSSRNRQQGDASGMGLYLTKQVTDALHIQLEVTSTLEEGTLCVLSFPRRNSMMDIWGV